MSAGTLLLLLCCGEANQRPASELSDAVYYGDAAHVEALLTANPKLINTIGNSSYTPLEQALQTNHHELIRVLLRYKPELNKPSQSYGYTPLCLAQDATVARWLLDQGASWKIKDPIYRRTPLGHAAWNGRVEVAKTLLAAGAPLDFQSAVNLGWTDKVAAMLKEKPWLVKAPNKALHEAAVAGHLAVAKLLLDHKADPNLVDDDRGWNVKITPLSKACRAGHYDAAKLLCDHGAKVDGVEVFTSARVHENLVFVAVERMDPRIVRLLLKHSVGTKPISGWGRGSLLHVAATRGDVEIAKGVLEFDGTLEAKGRNGETPLLLAAAHANKEVCQYLLKKGAALDLFTAIVLGMREEVAKMLKADAKLVNRTDEVRGEAPLFWAIAQGDLEMMQQLLRAHADVNAAAKDGNTPLHTACWHDNVPAIKLLIENGASVNTAGSEGDHPLHYAIRSKKAVELLLAAKADLNPVSRTTSNYAPTPLGRAADDGYLDVAELLFQHGGKLDMISACILGKLHKVAAFLAADPTLINRDSPRWGRKYIRYAVENGQVKMVEFLISKGAAVEPSLLYEAAAKGHRDMVAVLLSKGLSVNARTYGSTPLHEAAGWARPEAVRFLIEKKADVNAVDREGKTPLAHAVRALPAFSRGTTVREKEESCERVIATVGLLLAAKANLRIRNYDAQTVLHVAATGEQYTHDDVVPRRCHATVLKLLLDAGTEVDARDIHGYTPLHQAVQAGYPDLVAILLGKGAKVNARDQLGRTPLWHAQRGSRHPADREAIEQLLRKHGGRE